MADDFLSDFVEGFEDGLNGTDRDNGNSTNSNNTNSSGSSVNTPSNNSSSSDAGRKAQALAESIFNKEVDIMQYYNPFREKENEEPFLKGIPMIFVTTPYLNLTDTNTNGTFLSYLKNVEPRLLGALSYGYGNDGDNAVKTSSPFIKLLSNKFKGIQVKDYTARTLEINETFYGYKQMLPGSIIESVNGDELSIKYGETKNLSVIKLHKAWIDYMEATRRGQMAPSDFTREHRFIDYTSSIYYFLLDFDMETILYFTKYTGVCPLTVPLSVASMDIKDPAIMDDLDITYMYMAKEDLDPNIIIDFNLVAQATSDVFAYNTDTAISKADNLIETDKGGTDDFDVEDEYAFKNVKIVKRTLTGEERVNTGYSNADGMKNFVFKLKFF